MTKDEIIKQLLDMAKYPTVTLPRDCEALKAAAKLLAQPEPEPVAWQHRKPVEDAYGNAVGYTDWMNGPSAAWWPHRALYDHPKEWQDQNIRKTLRNFIQD